MMSRKNISLRALEPEDIDLLYIWENDTTIWNLSNTLTPFSRKVLNDYLLQAHLDIYTTKQLRLVICLPSGTAIGCIDLFDFDPQHLRAGVGILIADTAERNKGYASEALLLLIAYCKSKLNLHQLYCSIASSNKESISLFEKANFKLIGCKKDWQRIGSVYEDELFYQCIL